MNFHLARTAAALLHRSDTLQGALGHLVSPGTLEEALDIVDHAGHAFESVGRVGVQRVLARGPYLGDIPRQVRGLGLARRHLVVHRARGEGVLWDVADLSRCAAGVLVDLNAYGIVQADAELDGLRAVFELAQAVEISGLEIDPVGELVFCQIAAVALSAALAVSTPHGLSDRPAASHLLF